MRRLALLAVVACAESADDVVGAATGDATARDGGPCAAAGPSGCVYAALPSDATCQPGELAPEWEGRALTELNRVRRLAGVPEVGLDPTARPALQACTQVNALLQSTVSDPPATAQCWSEVAAAACRASNLTTMGLKVAGGDATTVFQALQLPEAFIDAWLLDDSPGATADAPSLGHRRWLLDPFLGPTAFGMGFSVTDQGDTSLIRQVGALRVATEAPDAPLEMAPGVVAWPVGDAPAALVDLEGWLLMSLVVSVENPADNAVVDFSGATVTVTRDGQPVPLATRADGATDLRFTGAGRGPVHGLTNHLQWKPAAALVVDAQYEVVVQGIGGANAPTSAQYAFRVIP